MNRWRRMRHAGYEQNVLNRSVRGWGNVTLKEFERDIKWLQNEVRDSSQSRKIYLVQVDNRELYEDYQDWIEKAFTTYRAASQYLIDQGYEPFVEEGWKGEFELHFYWEENVWYTRSMGEIIEMDLEE